MRNTVPAAGEAMPAAKINRRDALALTSTGMIAALGGLITPSAAAQVPDATALIDAHRQAWRAYDAACERLGNVEEANPVEPASVQCGRLLMGLNDDGSDEWKPLYAYSEDKINTVMDQNAAALRSIWPDNPNIADKVEQRRERLLAEFRRKQAEVAAAEASCGITAAEQEQVRASNAEQHCLTALTTHQFRSTDEIRQAAAYLLDRYRTGEIGYERMAEFVAALAGKQS